MSSSPSRRKRDHGAERDEESERTQDDVCIGMVPRRGPALSVGTDRWIPTSDGRINGIDVFFGEPPRGSSPPLTTDTIGTFLELMRNGINVRLLGVFNGGQFASDPGGISFQAGDIFTMDIIQVGTGFPGADATISFNVT